MEKQEKIERIKEIVFDWWGSVTTEQLQLDTSPCLNSIDGDDLIQLIERFNEYDVTAVTYYDDQIISERDYSYEELPYNIIDEIYHIMMEYEIDMLKTIERTIN